MNEEQKYRNREIDSMFLALTNKLDAVQATLMTHYQDTNRKLDSVEAKVTETNGRLKKIELWKAYVQGALVILGVIVGAIIIPLGVDAVKRLWG